TVAETQGQGWTRALHPHDMPMVAERWAMAMHAGTPFESQHRVRRRDGVFRWFISRALPLRDADGRIERWAGSLTDIDDLVGAEAALRTSERRTRQLLEGLPQLVWTCNPDGKCDYVSPQWQHYTGVERQHHLGRSWLRQVHRQDRPHIVDRWRTATLHGTMFEAESRIRGADGVYHWFQTRAVPLRDETGLITGWLGTDSDIEKLKQAEARLRSADQRKNDFLAMLSHELRNPLAPILSAASVLQAMVSPEPPIQAARDIITRQVAHIRQLVDDLLDMSRITRGQIALKRDTVSIADIVEHAVEACAPMLTARRHRFSVRLPDEAVRLEADLVRLVQVATNLLRNACDYTEAGGEIRLTVETERGYVLLRVSDSGIGIAPDLLPQIFDLFTQGPRSLARSTGGLGIGLSVAKQLVEMHGGTIVAHSAGPGTGSEFTVRLPRLAGSRASSASSGELRTQPGCNRLPAAPLRRVLIVDDNRDAANALSLLLSLEGHAVRQAYDGPNAITTARDFRPELVLLDIGLPLMDGFEVA
ncbi:MAG: PAS domain S-box protein, partial [Gammaproteobacteria bacterium]|nr:PAS domain S-box protein [Gammaproteobacteria bacterium]